MAKLKEEQKHASAHVARSQVIISIIAYSRHKHGITTVSRRSLRKLAPKSSAPIVRQMRPKQRYERHRVHCDILVKRILHPLL